MLNALCFAPPMLRKGFISTLARMAENSKVCTPGRRVAQRPAPMPFVSQAADAIVAWRGPVVSLTGTVAAEKTIAPVLGTTLRAATSLGCLRVREPSVGCPLTDGPAQTAAIRGRWARWRAVASPGRRRLSPRCGRPHSDTRRSADTRAGGQDVTSVLGYLWRASELLAGEDGAPEPESLPAIRCAGLVIHDGGLCVCMC
jgi:hypothetical protein